MLDVNERLARFGESALAHSRLSISEVTMITGLSRSMIYQLVKDGKFARPTKTGRASRWVLSEVLDFLQRAEAAR